MREGCRTSRRRPMSESAPEAVQDPSWTPPTLSAARNCPGPGGADSSWPPTPCRRPSLAAIHRRGRAPVTRRARGPGQRLRRHQGRGFELRQVAGGWRFYTRRLRRPGRAAGARRPGRRAHPGRAGDAVGRGLPAARHPGAGRGGARGQRRRGDAHAGGPRPDRGVRQRPHETGATSTSRPTCSWSGSASASTDGRCHRSSGPPARPGGTLGRRRRTPRASRMATDEPAGPSRVCRRCSPRPGSAAGASREDLIDRGRVEVDGEVVTEHGHPGRPRARRDPRRRHPDPAAAGTWSTWP